MSRFAKQILLAGLLSFSLAGVASAQDANSSSSCQEFQTLMAQRKSLIDQLTAAAGKGKKQLDPHQACTIFTKLSTHGAKAIKWLDENKAWCQIPDEFVDGFKKDQGQVNATRGQACKVAAQVDAARRNAQGGVPPAWGGGVHGQYQIPKGAL